MSGAEIYHCYSSASGKIAGEICVNKKIQLQQLLLCHSCLLWLKWKVREQSPGDSLDESLCVPIPLGLLCGLPNAAVRQNVLERCSHNVSFLPPLFSPALDTNHVPAFVRALLTYPCPACDLLAVFALQGCSSLRC